MEVLVYLSKHSEEVLPKERIIQAIWPDTFVTDDVLAHAISELRKAFDDTPKDSRYIQTIPRRGYRLVATVEFPEELAEIQSGAFFSRSRRHVWLVLGIAAILVLVVGIAIFQGWLSFPESEPVVAPALQAAPLTTYLGHEITPDFSPRGDQIAFSWTGPDQNIPNWDIYVKQIGPGDPHPLITHPRSDFAPRWSPDGQEIAFIRDFPDRITILTTPSLAGVERPLAEIVKENRFDRGSSGISWSADGESIAVSFRPGGEEESRVVVLSVDSGEMKQLTFPPAGIYGDHFGQYSPDGRTIAFFRRNTYSSWDLYIQALEDIDPKPLTFEGFPSAFGLAWMPDSQEIVFSAGPTQNNSLWRVKVSGGDLVPLGGYGENLRRAWPAVSRTGDRLVYVESAPNEGDIWRIANPRKNPSKEAPLQLISSTRDDMDPSVSPDGSRIAFVSNRTGYFQVYVCRSDGSQLKPLTELETGANTPKWSPGSSQISFHSSFHSQLEGTNDIYVVNSEGGSPRRLTTHPGDDIVANWSLDGRFIYFASNRTGEYQTWKIPFQGGDAIQITRHGGHFARESSDGYLYYSRGNPGEIWKTPVGGGEETPVLRERLHRWSWDLSSEGVYFTTRERKGDLWEWHVHFLEFVSGETKEILVQEVPLSPGDWTLSPDEQWFFVVLNTPPGSRDLMLVQNFR
jgi:Tol biopolymer transport system component